MNNLFKFCLLEGHFCCLYLVDRSLGAFLSCRPSTTELLKMPFIKKAKNKEFIKEVVLGGAPSLQSRARKVCR